MERAVPTCRTLSHGQAPSWVFPVPFSPWAPLSIQVPMYPNNDGGVCYKDSCLLDSAEMAKSSLLEVASH